MAYIMRSRSLVVLTLLQLCRAEISDTLSESWFSANVIHDGFQPKPLSEIFSTPPAFSSTNPIVVLSKSSQGSNEVVSFSTLPPLPMMSNTESTFDSLPKFTSPPSKVSTPLPLSVQNLASQTISTANPAQSPQPQYQLQDTQPLLPDYSQAIPSQPQITQQTLPPSTPLFRPESQPTTISIPPPISQQTTLSVSQLNPQQTTLGIPETPPSQPPIFVPPTPAPQNPIRFDLAQPGVLRETTQQLPQSQTENRSNYILLYQPAPQYYQGEMMSASQEVPQVTNSQPTITSQPISSTAQPMISSLPPIQPAPTIFSSSTRRSPTFSTSLRPDVDVVRSRGPCNNTGPSAMALSAIPQIPLKIRVVAPQGSLTKVVIKSLTTTTRKPTTKRTRKPKRNTYESCVSGCKGNRKPICGIPLSTTVIDPNTLKGFLTACHMACHNSYRKQAYEQLLEGRCSLLRTRIRTIDSNTKLKRDELNKAQYFVDKTEPLTVVEFSGALHQ